MEEEERSSSVKSDRSSEQGLNTMLTEIKSFHQDNKQQLGEIKEEISKAKQRIDEAEERIVSVEERMQSMEEVTSWWKPLLLQRTGFSIGAISSPSCRRLLVLQVVRLEGHGCGGMGG